VDAPSAHRCLIPDRLMMKRRTPAVTRAFVVPGVLFAVGFAGAFFYLRPDGTEYRQVEGTAAVEALDARGSSTPPGRDATRSLAFESSATASPAARAQRRAAERDLEPQPSPSPQTLQTLALTATTEGDSTARHSAIAALSDLARSGYEVSAVRDTLRLAAADDDASVAERAKEAYDELIRNEDSPPQNPDSGPALD
jgi:hypothetical protein